MQFKKLTLEDKDHFEKYLSIRKHSLSAYAFENIFIWSCMYEIFWVEIEANLCVFFKDRVGCFLYLPPQGQRFHMDVIDKCFGIMDSFNKNTIISRVENVEMAEVKRYKDLAYKIVLAGCDYLCRRKELSDLKGAPFKKKRTLVNYFLNNYNFKYGPYKARDKKECLDLYLSWMEERKAKNSDIIYQRLLEDNFRIFKTTLNSYSQVNFIHAPVRHNYWRTVRDFAKRNPEEKETTAVKPGGFIGRVIKIDGKLKAMTFGYPLTRDTFVVLFEVCDLKFKGISQYIFKEFSKELNYKYINIMDDSGLDNLKKVKLSYRPYKTIDNFVVSRE